VHWEVAVSGLAEFPRDEIGRAEALAKEALALEPATTKANLLLAYIGMYQKDYERALSEVDRALAINPSDADGYQMRGGILEWSGKAAEAVPWLEGAVRLGGANTTVLMNLIRHLEISPRPAPR
jgi:adenylate cyclase